MNPRYSGTKLKSLSAMNVEDARHRRLDGLQGAHFEKSEKAVMQCRGSLRASIDTSTRYGYGVITRTALPVVRWTVHAEGQGVIRSVSIHWTAPMVPISQPCLQCDPPAHTPRHLDFTDRRRGEARRGMRREDTILPSQDALGIASRSLPSTRVNDHVSSLCSSRQLLHHAPQIIIA